MQEAILLVKLMRYALQQGEFQYDEKVDNVKLEELIRDQNLVSFVYPALAQLKDERFAKIVQHLEQEYNEELHRALVQQIEMDNLLEQLENKEMDCLPLKGYFMKDYYAEPTFRSMTDFDVLLREFDEKEIQLWMESIGYQVKEQGDEHHDVYVKKPYMVAEMHKNLSDEKVEREIPQIDEWLEKAWDRCILEKGKQHTYKMTEEDFYIYHLIHFYKHMRSGGISVRPLVDIHVFLEKAKDRLNWNYIHEVFEELQLTQFEKRVETLSKKCFGSEVSNLNEEEGKLLLFFFQSGLFGTLKTFETSKVITENGNSYLTQRTGALWRAIFQPARNLKDKYPVLIRFPFLLPVVWIVRIFRVMCKEKYKIEIMNEGGAREEYNKMKEIFQIAGITNKKSF